MTAIVTLTLNPAIDLNTDVGQIQPEAKLRCSRPRREPGGGGLNVSRAIARMGGTSRAFHTAGGPAGDTLGALLNDEGVDHHPLAVSGWTRENLFVLEESGQQFRFLFPGPELSDDEWRGILDHLAALDPAPDPLVASGSLPPGVPDDFYARLAERLGDDTRLVVDTSGDALRRAVDGGVYLIKPNVRELAQLAGRELESEEEQTEAARDLLDRGCCQAVVLSLGAGGALLVHPGGSRHVRSPTVPIRSKVGAGDSMVAGIVLALSRGEDLEDAVRRGVAAGAAAVQTPGTELCRGEDVEELVERVE